MMMANDIKMKHGKQKNVDTRIFLYSINSSVYLSFFTSFGR